MHIQPRERSIALAIGFASLALFGTSIATLVWFLLARVDPPVDQAGEAWGWLRRATGREGDARTTYDALLVLAWGFLHSFMARPRFKEALRTVVRPHLHAALYSMVASLGLVALCLLFQPMPREVYALEGGPGLVARLVFYAGWALFLYCWLHLDLLEIVGLRPIRRYLDGQAAPRAPFRPSGPFLWVRHPVELSFLIAFWAAPRMTAGHLLFAALMTIYAFVGIDLVDRRMLEVDGPGYLDYMRRVPQIIPLPR
jgi:hypothetical protein